MGMIKNYRIRVRGIVQGVGFRPFIYRIAREKGLRGWVLNDTEGVEIEAEGEEASLMAFLEEIRNIPPPLSRIQSVEIAEGTLQGHKDFHIEASRLSNRRDTFVSPDTAVCSECLEEFFDEENFRHHYPFITCTNCGPRFSIVYDIPYDRKNTSMAGFPMCRTCAGEYADPGDRRFHTQPNACPLCGPHLLLQRPDGSPVARGSSEIARKTLELLKGGSIIALKGVGGYLLAADALSDEPLSELRRRKGRPFKPFALMAGSVESFRRFLDVTGEAERLLVSRERPIVVLRENAKLISRLVAPSLSYVGAMLPYAPFQRLLFSLEPDSVLVMTSANLSDEPIIFRDEDAFRELGRIADYFITYNRDIVAQSDDSVIFLEKDIPFFVRRARGYVPMPFVSSPAPVHMLATGGDLKNSFALAKEGMAVLSQYLGDLATPAGNDLFRRTITHFERIHDFRPEVVVSDRHPGYFTTAFADELEAGGLKRFRVQHHHAHIVSVMEDLGLEERIIGIAFDGTGYGDDGRLWGSEFLLADRGHFVRAAHFSYFPLPGGESAIRDVWKIGLSLLYRVYGDNVSLEGYPPEAGAVLEIMKRGINSPETCSIGRLFDGISALLGISRVISTEAEAAMLLEEEALGWQGGGGEWLIPFSGGMEMEISTEGLTEYLLGLIKRGQSRPAVAWAFHAALARTSVAVAEQLRDASGLNRVVLSGGAFQNRLLLRMVMEGLAEKRFDIFIPEKIPFNDGCLALGQLAIAKELLKNG